MRTDRLSEKTDIKKLFRFGRKVRTPFFSFSWSKNNKKHLRVLCVIAKKTAKSSVTRNRIRRRINEWFRKNKDFSSSPIDIAVIVGVGAITASKKAFYKDLSDGTKKINV